MDRTYWQAVGRGVVRRINRSLVDALREPTSGIGKPEPLKYEIRGAKACSCFQPTIGALILITAGATTSLTVTGSRGPMPLQAEVPSVRAGRSPGLDGCGHRNRRTTRQQVRVPADPCGMSAGADRLAGLAGHRGIIHPGRRYTK